MNVNQTSALNIKKILILGFIMSIIGLVVVMRIFELSLPNSYEQVSNKKQYINNTNQERGLLLDRNENIIASNIYVYSLKAYPRKINKPEKMIQLLKEHVDFNDFDAVKRKIYNKDKFEVVIKKKYYCTRG